MPVDLHWRHLHQGRYSVVLAARARDRGHTVGDLLEVELCPVIEISPRVGVQDVLVSQRHPCLLCRDVTQHRSDNCHSVPLVLLGAAVSGVPATETVR